MPGDVSIALVERNVNELEFRALVEATVEIIWGSLYAACDNEESLGYLQQVLSICQGRGVAPPPLAVFAESRFADQHGWGTTPTGPQLERWRHAGAA